MNSASPILKVEALEKRFGAVDAARDVNIDVFQAKSSASSVPMGLERPPLSIWSQGICSLMAAAFNSNSKN